MAKKKSKGEEKKPRVFKKAFLDEVSYVDDGANLKEFMIFKRKKKSPDKCDEEEVKEKKEVEGEDLELDEHTEGGGDEEMAKEEKTKQTAEIKGEVDVEAMAREADLRNKKVVDPEQLDTLAELNEQLDSANADVKPEPKTEVAEKKNSERMTLDTPGNPIGDELKKESEVVNEVKDEVKDEVLADAKEEPVDEKNEPQNTVDDKNPEIENLKTLLAEKEREIEALKNEIPDRKAIVEEPANSRDVDSDENELTEFLDKISNPEFKYEMNKRKLNPIESFKTAMKDSKAKLNHGY